MGIDTVEVWMACEEEFGVEITQEEAERARTVGDLYACILKKFRYMASPGCLSSKVFYRFRRGLMGALGVPRESVRPKTAMAELVRVESRRANWEALSRAVDFELPRLVRPGWMWCLIYGPMVAGVPAFLAACLAAGVRNGLVSIALLATAFGCVALGALTDRATTRFALLLRPTARPWGAQSRGSSG